MTDDAKLTLDDFTSSEWEWFEKHGYRLYETGEGVFLESKSKDEEGEPVWSAGPLKEIPHLYGLTEDEL